MIINQLSFQDGKTPLIIAISEFHDYSMGLIIFILILVTLFMMETLFFNSYSFHNIKEELGVEARWTSLPSITLVLLARSSIWLLYELESHSPKKGDDVLSIKATGHQWYWSYEYADFNNLTFDSYIVPDTLLHLGQFRLLEVDNRLVLPWNSFIRVFVSSADVLHAWTIPSLGVKADAVPGRLNLLHFSPKLPGTYYGQCSEICGANHSFMPIAAEVVRPSTFNSWTNNISTQ